MKYIAYVLLIAIYTTICITYGAYSGHGYAVCLAKHSADYCVAELQ